MAIWKSENASIWNRRKSCFRSRKSFFRRRRSCFCRRKSCPSEKKLPKLGEKVTVRRAKFVEEVTRCGVPSIDRVRETIVLKNIYKTILP